jgi:hypothetical protein
MPDQGKGSRREGRGWAKAQSSAAPAKRGCLQAWRRVEAGRGWQPARRLAPRPREERCQKCPPPGVPLAEKHSPPPHPPTHPLTHHWQPPRRKRDPRPHPHSALAGPQAPVRTEHGGAEAAVEGGAAALPHQHRHRARHAAQLGVHSQAQAQRVQRVCELEGGGRWGGEGWHVGRCGGGLASGSQPSPARQPGAWRPGALQLQLC